MKAMEEKRNNFMREVQMKVWKRLMDRSIDFTLGEINKHFTDMMRNPKLKEEIVKIFLAQFIYDDGCSHYEIEEESIKINPM